MPAHASASFFDAWDTYQKVVTCDYMFHREIGEALNQLLRAHFGGRPFSILDLGCGDAATLTPLLEGLTLQRYKGVDLSETALVLAAENLKTLACPVQLTQGHILATLAEDASYDVIYSSFALHHLPTAQKAEFFHLAAQRLNKGGLLLLVMSCARKVKLWRSIISGIANGCAAAGGLSMRTKRTLSAIIS